MVSTLSAFDKFGLFVASAGAWTALFLVIDRTITSKNLKRKDVDDIKNRIVSILHGLIALVTSAIHIIKDNPAYGNPNTRTQEIIIIMSFGYFFYDMIACAYYKLTDTGLIIHHTSAMLGYLTSLVNGVGCTDSLMGLYLAEYSNLPMHLRKILRTLNLRYTLSYEVLELAYLAIYSVSRGIFCPKMMIESIFIPQTPILVKLMMAALTFQSLHYITEMIQIFRKRYQEFRERRVKGVKFHWLTVSKDVSKLSYYQKESRQKIF
eukprot:TRINITY_DN1936_c0_g1_i4.p1 TRINITY_DN1936_c0_g1~~TRINITY_DN1936_c0_g1_i4.p1  ORF type:complete len:264 (+),score=51.90 TRINITY_DN1936_c0_g1_i4:75-866(+)